MHAQGIYNLEKEKRPLFGGFVLAPTPNCSSWGKRHSPIVGCLHCCYKSLHGRAITKPGHYHCMIECDSVVTVSAVSKDSI